MRVIWSPRSKRNLDQIFDYILAENPAAAVKIIDAIEARVTLLEAHPNLGRPGKVSDTRELVVTGTPYIVAYRIQPRSSKIEILAARHGAREWPESFD